MSLHETNLSRLTLITEETAPPSSLPVGALGSQLEVELESLSDMR